MPSLFEQFKAQIDKVDLGQVAVEGIESYKEIMREKVPQGVSPVKGGIWRDDLNEKYSFRKAKRFTDFADLSLGEKRYVKLFNKVNQSANSAEFDYDSSYGDIAIQHQTGNYDRGEVKPRNLIPQSKEQLPDKVLEAVKQSFLAKI